MRNAALCLVAHLSVFLVASAAFGQQNRQFNVLGFQRPHGAHVNNPHVSATIHPVAVQNLQAQIDELRELISKPRPETIAGLTANNSASEDRIFSRLLTRVGPVLERAPEAFQEYERQQTESPEEGPLYWALGAGAVAVGGPLGALMLAVQSRLKKRDDEETRQKQLEEVAAKTAEKVAENS